MLEITLCPEVSMELGYSRVNQKAAMIFSTVFYPGDITTHFTGSISRL